MYGDLTRLILGFRSVLGDREVLETNPEPSLDPSSDPRPYFFSNFLLRSVSKFVQTDPLFLIFGDDAIDLIASLGTRLTLFFVSSTELIELSLLKLLLRLESLAWDFRVGFLRALRVEFRGAWFFYHKFFNFSLLVSVVVAFAKLPMAKPSTFCMFKFSG